MRIVCSNLDFEYEWSSALAGRSYVPTKVFKQLTQRWKYALRLLPEEENATILEPGEGKQTFSWEEVEHIQMWGLPPVEASPIPSDRAPRLVAGMPELDIVALVNGKDFSHKLEREFGVAIPGSLLFSTSEELKEQVLSCPFDWVVKHPWGVSGRERIQGKAGDLQERHLRWVVRQFKRGTQLIFEPWLQSTSEFSMHYMIEPNQSVSFLGLCQLMADGSGTYRGNGCATSFSISSDILAIAEKVVLRMAELGYWGPVGIDAMCGILGEKKIVRPIMEINARITFGRLTLALERFIPEGWSWVWWHPTPKESQQITEQRSYLPVNPFRTKAGLYRLPECADPEGSSGTFVWISPEDHLPNPPYQ